MSTSAIAVPDMIEAFLLPLGVEGERLKSYGEAVKVEPKAPEGAVGSHTEEALKIQNRAS